ncbi:cytochrome b-c1 complex subunit Rieske [Fimicolochytrium jonesii]|uniref:cytochrome b-c1 complex subunit Rieske n=1 Tax=Fimicolochytrium jonesii TaxID=1396493 RepID=UPI0022FE936B|nr:cytochrome b-c1 complex subunit Rieske [Fimicolochytrium jonesii]KAI8817522.1 cytochrome b-c1 complex subunit Rieske [Fimicolochytrium jonesii]
MASKVSPALAASRTFWAKPIVGTPRSLTASPAKASKASVPYVARPVLATINGAQLSSKTHYTAGPNFLSQKRYYASPVKQVQYSADVTVPPREQDAYKVKNYNEYSSRNYAYFMIGAYSFVGAVMAKNIVTDYLVHMAASADVLALAKVELDMASIPEGKNVVIKWRGKPVFVRHRTAEEIAEANAVNVAELRDPETDAERTKNPEWLVMLGVCTHLGCVPIGEAGEYGGWFCPCHGSHYDISGRIRKGPAPLNLEIPAYELNDADGKIIVG